ncbi:hypothetical protein, partial [Akkermansia sp.]|uniref:hypothetical protein n=1 Tax=Akkermansia sp. TaxID=1872421 RepID=UPI003AB263D3
GGVGGGGVPPGMEGGGGLLISEKIAVLKDSSRLFPSVNQEKECAKFVFHAIFFNSARIPLQTRCPDLP